MKVLYFGGQKSGKSRLAEEKALALSSKPYYIATYDSGYGDSEMQRRIERHQNDRSDRFITIEESSDFEKVIQKGGCYLVDCLSMWILNTLERSEEDLLEQLEHVAQIDADIVFVLNDVGNGVIPIDSESRKFVDLSGMIGQRVATMCDEVYEVKYGIAVQIK
jgi:adenosylcobinamide kinase/adenosylcobinamide-phosphate guanylyltransferase